MRSEHEKIAPLPSAEGLFRPLDFSTLAGSPRSVRWLVDGYIPRGSCVLFSGPTKIGKSYVLQHLMTCLALGVPWFGHATERCKVFGLFCEEDAPPLHWRRDQILHYLDAAPEDFEAGGFMGYPRRGQANHLVRFDRRTDQGQMTPLWDKLKFAVREKYGSQFVLLDTCRQVFDGDENRASQVTVFLNELNRFAEEIDGCVVITQQPAKAVELGVRGVGCLGGDGADPSAPLEAGRVRLVHTRARRRARVAQYGCKLFRRHSGHGVALGPGLDDVHRRRGCRPI